MRLHDFPSTIISDRDRIFMSLFWRELFKLQGTSLRRSTAYHPQTDGQTEVINKTMECYLRFIVNGQPRTWSTWLPWAEYCYNTSVHASTKYSLFQELYGQEPPHLLRFKQGSTAVATLEELMIKMDDILDDLKTYLLQAQQCMKLYEDAKRRGLEFRVGESVYLKLQPY